jgi:diguanylate cyclase (GGDEF)-like protein
VEKGGYPLTLLQKYGVMNTEIISDWETGFSKVVSGELDAIVVDRWIGEYELAQNGVKDIQIVDEPIETQYTRLAVKKGNIELLQLINTGLEEMNDDDAINKILRNWRGKEVIYLTQESFRNIILYLIIAFLSLILLIAMYSINKYRKLSRKLEVDVKERTKELYETNKLLLKANAELEKISMIDELTTIFNRRAFDIAFEKLWKASMSPRKPLAIIMIDIDHFKHLNDTYGHLVGDQCLIKIAKELKSVVNETRNFVARFGGEEFVVMLSDTTEDCAAIVAENMRKKIENLGIENSNVNSIVTISLGVASVIPNYAISPKDLIDAADRALYQAKEDGRNKVVKSEERFVTVE